MLTVVLPVFNAAPFIRRSLESILSQTFDDFQLLIVDDGSTDETPFLLAALAKKDSRIRVLTLPRTGVAGAFNAGLQEARGTYIARMDADDEMHPQRLEKQIAFLEQHPQTGLVSSLVTHGGDPVTQEGYATHISWINTLVTHEEISLGRFIDSPISNPSVMFRSSLVEKFGGCRNGDFPEDYEMWLRWLDAGVRMEKIPEALLKWNDPPTRLTRTDARYSPEAFSRIKAGYLANFIHQKIGSRKLWLCGAGRITRQKSAFLIAEGLPIGGYVDVDPAKIGKRYGDLPVITLNDLPPAQEAYVVSYVGNRGAREAIRKILLEKGFVEGNDFVLAG